MSRKLPNDYAPSNPAASEGVNHVRTFGPRKPAPKEESVIDLDKLKADVARAICEAANVPGFKCGCPHPLDGYCLGGAMPKKASAAIAVVLEAAKAEVEQYRLLEAGNREQAVANDRRELVAMCGHSEAVLKVVCDLLKHAAAAARGGA